MSDQTQDSKKLQKKAKRKRLNIPVINHLVALNSPLKSKYQSTFYCSASIKTFEGKTSSRYCKRPWCNICNPIRVAIRLNAYQEQLNKIMQELGLAMTTLTLPNCSASFIKPSFERFRSVFRQFRNTLKKQGIEFKGVYNLECSIRPNLESGKRFHPHIHIIHNSIECWVVKGKEWKAQVKGGVSTGCNLKWSNILIEYWLKHNPQADRGGQDTRKCTSLIEGFKYTNKSIFKIRINGKSKLVVPVSDLDTIYNAIVGMRLFQPFGIRKTITDEDKEFERLESYNVETKPDGIYKWLKHDWFHKVDSTPLSDYIPTEKDNELYEQLTKNTHYKKAPSLPHQKRVWTIPEPSGQDGDISALQRILNKRREESTVP